MRCVLALLAGCVLAGIGGAAAQTGCNPESTERWLKQGFTPQQIVEMCKATAPKEAAEPEKAKQPAEVKAGHPWDGAWKVNVSFFHPIGGGWSQYGIFQTHFLKLKVDGDNRLSVRMAWSCSYGCEDDAYSSYEVVKVYYIEKDKLKFAVRSGSNSTNISVYELEGLKVDEFGISRSASGMRTGGVDWKLRLERHSQ